MKVYFNHNRDADHIWLVDVGYSPNFNKKGKPRPRKYRNFGPTTDVYRYDYESGYLMESDDGSDSVDYKSLQAVSKNNRYIKIFGSNKKVTGKLDKNIFGVRLDPRNLERLFKWYIEVSPLKNHTLEVRI